MKLTIVNTYEELSRLAADDVIRVMHYASHPLLCPASGDSPAGLYKELATRFTNQELNVTPWYFVGLDEWVGMDGGDEGSCRYHLNQQLFDPLQVLEERICFFDGKAVDLTQECDKVEDFISEHGGIELAVVGLGMNGHIGMNEPGTPSAHRSHVTNLDPVTQKVGQKYFKEQTRLTQGITLGLANLMEARHLILIVSGNHKASIVKQMLEGDISEQLPASILRQHPNLRIYLDKDAAALINPVP